ncbi:hypothetical protein HPB51_012810 [Rhipicephalus microplus]|uniref:Uncharacterized protein n=1 Tax=Rhipicephalus microplus TaxID=6941 RepID=A0A9J6D9Z1_RHIMP|nr:hypothetical protein HPB51_012810 [Rhipicephalus microplus]
MLQKNYTSHHGGTRIVSTDARWRLEAILSGAIWEVGKVNALGLLGLSFAVDIRYSSGRARAAHVSLSPKRPERLIYAASVADKALLIKAARSGTCAIRGTRGGVGLARFIGPTRRSDSQSPLSLQRSVVDSFPVIWRPRPGRLAADRQPPVMHATAQHMCRLAYEPRCAVTGLPWKPIVFSECRPFGRWQRTLRPQRAMRERGDGETRKLSWFTLSGDDVLSFS